MALKRAVRVTGQVEFQGMNFSTTERILNAFWMIILLGKPNIALANMISTSSCGPIPSGCIV